MIITITGKPCSGKSAVIDYMTSKYGFEKFSAGAIFRRIATERGVDILELNRLCDTSIDKLVDDVADSMKKTVSKLNLDFNKMVHMVNVNSSMLDSTSDAISIQREKAHSVAEATANMESSIEKVTEFARSTLSEVKNAGSFAVSGFKSNISF